jgi:predicted N-formylglutamate amidohydrolase
MHALGRLATGVELKPVRKDLLVISCEHGGCEVPREYAALFLGRDRLLTSHRGWDAGALEVASQMAAALGAPLYAATTTRLLVDLNRSIGHRQLFSEITRPLAPARRLEILDRHYRPHRQTVESQIARHIASGRRVIHVASHSFTPMLEGVPRQADVAWLYDPRRPGEVALAGAWRRALEQRGAQLRLRRNYPYQGRADGLTASLRRHHDAASYVGLELEVNQRFVEQGGGQWTRLRKMLVDSLQTALAAIAKR